MKILIVGAGIAGLSMARALELQGIRFDIIDASAEQARIGFGLYLPGNATRALDELGLLPAIQLRSRHIRRQRILDANGSILNDVEVDAVWRGCGPCLAASRIEVQDVLLNSLRTTAVEFGRSVARLEAVGQLNAVTFNDGSSSEYDLVVGADGIRSSIRRLAFEPYDPKDLGIVCLRFLAQNNAGIDCWTAMLGPKRTLLAIPVSDDEVYVYADIAGGNDLPHEAPAVPMLRSLFQGFGGPLGSIISTLDPAHQVGRGRLEEVTLQSWHTDRVVLIGDAAHASSPSMAEGAGMAMEDALVLAQEISNRGCVAAALTRYSGRRRTRVTWVQAQCHARDMARSLPRPARNALFSLFGNRLYKRSYQPLTEAF